MTNDTLLRLLALAADMNVSQESDQPVFFGIERDNVLPHL
jgi:hypothetical protein